MKKTFAIIAVLILTTPLIQAEETETEDVSGIVRVVRSNPEAEIFFVDRKDSVIVPAHAVDGNKIIKMSLDSIKTKKPVSMTIDPVSRRFISLPGSKKSATTTATESAVEIVTEPSAAPAVKKPIYKEVPSDNAK